MAVNPYYDGPGPTHKARPTVHFSRTELLHLGASVLVLTVAFAFVLRGGLGFFTPERFEFYWLDYVASFLAVGSGFVLHELAHKVVAQRYMHWAEFRGWFRGLLMSLLFAAGLGFLFATPGAVQIWGRVTPRENGVISIAGPATNLLISLIAMPVPLFADITKPVPYVLAVVAVVNAVLCVFNLLPFGALDGRKVLRWNLLAYLGILAAAIAVIAVLVAANVWVLGG